MHARGPTSDVKSRHLQVYDVDNMVNVGMQVMPPHGASSERNALVYKLRSPDSAVLNSYARLKRQHADSIPARYDHNAGQHCKCAAAALRTTC